MAHIPAGPGLKVTHPHRKMVVIQPSDDQPMTVQVQRKHSNIKKLTVYRGKAKNLKKLRQATQDRYAVGERVIRRAGGAAPGPRRVPLSQMRRPV